MAKHLIILTKEESLVAIRDWDFMPNDCYRIQPIPLTIPKDLTVEQLGNIVGDFATSAIIDGDVRPGTASLLIVSEALARELISTYGCRFIKVKAFIHASALWYRWFVCWISERCGLSAPFFLIEKWNNLFIYFLFIFHNYLWIS